MRNPNVDPGGKKYNFEDPLGIIGYEKSIEQKLTQPNPIQVFLEKEALIKDKSRIRLAHQKELLFEFYDIVRKLINMVVTFESKGKYLKGRIKYIRAGMLQVCLRGTKEFVYVDFDEVLRLKNNYD